MHPTVEAPSILGPMQKSRCQMIAACEFQRAKYARGMRIFTPLSRAWGQAIASDADRTPQECALHQQRAPSNRFLAFTCPTSQSTSQLAGRENILPTATRAARHRQQALRADDGFSAAWHSFGSGTLRGRPATACAVLAALGGRTILSTCSSANALSFTPSGVHRSCLIRRLDRVFYIRAFR